MFFEAAPTSTYSKMASPNRSMILHGMAMFSAIGAAVLWCKVPWTGMFTIQGIVFAVSGAIMQIMAFAGSCTWGRVVKNEVHRDSPPIFLFLSLCCLVPAMAFAGAALIFNGGGGLTAIQFPCSLVAVYLLVAEWCARMEQKLDTAIQKIDMIEETVLSARVRREFESRLNVDG